jgi:hypothetical protein
MSGIDASPRPLGMGPGSWIHRLLAAVLAGLNQLLALGDFSRGDNLRD